LCCICWTPHCPFCRVFSVRQCLVALCSTWEQSSPTKLLTAPTCISSSRALRYKPTYVFRLTCRWLINTWGWTEFSLKRVCVFFFKENSICTERDLSDYQKLQFFFLLLLISYNSWPLVWGFFLILPNIKLNYLTFTAFFFFKEVNRFSKGR
jgi:hypothetical protein